MPTSKDPMPTLGNVGQMSSTCYANVQSQSLTLRKCCSWQDYGVQGWSSEVLVTTPYWEGGYKMTYSETFELVLLKQMTT